MAASTSTISFDVHDCKVYPVTADATGGITYGAAVDVPGIQEVSVEPNFISVELKGDGKVLAKKGKVDRLNFSMFSPPSSVVLSEHLVLVLPRQRRTSSMATLFHTSRLKSWSTTSSPNLPRWSSR